MPDSRIWLVVGFAIAGLAISAWVFAPALRGPVEARRYVGTHRLALGSLVVVLLANLVLTAPVAPLVADHRLNMGTFMVAALGTQIPMLLVLYGRLIAPGALTWRDLGLRLIPLGQIVSVGVATGFAALLLAGLIGALLSRLGVRLNQAEQFNFVRSEGVSGFLVVLLVGVVVTPFVEELFFRGFLFGLYVRRKPLWVAYLVSGLLFAVLHANPAVMDLGQNVGLILAVFALGTLLAWTYQRTGSLFPGMVAHGVNNGVTLLALYAAGVT